MHGVLDDDLGLQVRDTEGEAGSGAEHEVEGGAAQAKRGETGIRAEVVVKVGDRGGRRKATSGDDTVVV